MLEAECEIARWVPAGVVRDPREKGRVAVRLLYSPGGRTWAYRTYLGGSEKGVTLPHCMEVAAALLEERPGDEVRVGRTRKGRRGWGDRDLDP